MADRDDVDANGADGRRETSTERLDRNWNSLLQELRVVQTGGQILTGLMLTIPFQQRFTDLNDGQQRLFLVSLVLAVLSTFTLIAPVALHRLLFRQRAVAELVARAHVLAMVGLALLGLALTGVLALIFDIVAGTVASVAAGVCTLGVFVAMWVIMPIRMRRRFGDHRSDTGA